MYIILALTVDALVLCEKGVRLLCTYSMFRSAVFYIQKKKIVFTMCLFRSEDDDSSVTNLPEFIFFREYMH